MLLLILLTTSLTIGLAITSSLVAFEALSFLVGMLSVVPQILIPLAADLAPPERRASAIAVVLGGLLLGVLVARVISGVIAEFVSWRIVYYLAIGLQATVLAGMYALLPDYPAKNPGLTYWGILMSMAKYAVTEPLLIQTSLILLCSSACFSNFWVTLTFLLDGSPYYYSTYDMSAFASASSGSPSCRQAGYRSIWTCRYGRRGHVPPRRAARRPPRTMVRDAHLYVGKRCFPGGADWRGRRAHRGGRACVRRAGRVPADATGLAYQRGLWDRSGGASEVERSDDHLDLLGPSDGYATR